MAKGLRSHGKEFGSYFEYKEMPLDSAKHGRGTSGKMKNQRASHRDGWFGFLEEDSSLVGTICLGEDGGALR